jgi:hypothetical protein
LAVGIFQIPIRNYNTYMVFDWYWKIGHKLLNPFDYNVMHPLICSALESSPASQVITPPLAS